MKVEKNRCDFESWEKYNEYISGEVVKYQASKVQEEAELEAAVIAREVTKEAAVKAAVKKASAK